MRKIRIPLNRRSSTHVKTSVNSLDDCLRLMTESSGKPGAIFAQVLPIRKGDQLVSVELHAMVFNHDLATRIHDEIGKQEVKS